MDRIHVAEHQNARLVARRIAADPQDVAKGRRRLLALAHGAGSFEEARNRLEHAVDACGVARWAFDLNDAADVGKDGVAVDRVLKKGGHVGPSVGGAVVFQSHQNSTHESCARITLSLNVVRIWNVLFPWRDRRDIGQPAVSR
jgi:hypothetical protein